MNDCMPAGYDFHFANAVAVRGAVAVLGPQKRHYWVQQTDNSHAAISVSWSRDLFVAMGNDLGDGAWSMRIQYKPLVRFIWLGALTMALGGFIAATDRRYRTRSVAEKRAPVLPLPLPAGGA